MAVVEYWGPTWLNVVWDGTSDYELTESILLRAVRFYPSAVNDKLTVMQKVRGESDSSKWPFFTLISTDGGAVAMFEPAIGVRPQRAMYTIDYSKCTFTTPANIIIQFVYEA